MQGSVQADNNNNKHDHDGYMEHAGGDTPSQTAPVLRAEREREKDTKR